MVKRCHDCRKADKSVDIRQCDYNLCDKCENKRKEDDRLRKEKEKPKNVTTKTTSTPAVRKKEHATPAIDQGVNKDNQSVLHELFATPTKLLNAGFAAASSLLVNTETDPSNAQLPQVLEQNDELSLPPAKCSYSKCYGVGPNEPICSCSVCSNHYHLACAGLAKPPVRKWTCFDCRDLHSLAKNLQATVVSL